MALLPRLSALDRYVTPDELRWVDRSIRFGQAISQHDWGATIQSGHPGVITMWLGSLGILLRQGGLPAERLTGEFTPQDPLMMRALAHYLTAARLPIILVVSLNIVVLFWLLSRVIDRRAAFLAAGLIALEPFAVALGSIAHVDALMTTFSLNALAALCVALNRPRPTRWLCVSGGLGGLAMLSKSPALILSVAVFIIIVADTLRGRQTLRRRQLVGQAIRRLFIWGISAALIFILLYPAMWTAPLKAVTRMGNTAEKFSETAHAVNYFNGSNARDPGPLFYPAVIAFRSTPLLWLGLIASVVLIVRVKSRGETASAKRLRSIAWVYWVFAVVFLGVITLGAKKLDRYALPALEALCLVSALGWVYMIEAVGVRVSAPTKRTWILNGVVVLILLISALQFVQVWPLTLRAFNPVLGGYDAAKAVLPVGGGEGAEVGRILNTSAYADRVIAVSDVVGTAPYFTGEMTVTTPAGLAFAEDMLFTVADFQLTPDVTHTWIGAATPVLTIPVQGQPYAWLYPNEWLTGQQQRFHEKYLPGDVLLTDAAANVPVPPDAIQLIPPDTDEASAIQLLQQIAQSHKRVWVTHYAASSRRTMNPLFGLLDTYAVQLDEWTTPLGDGALYALPDQVSFTTQPTPLKGETTFGDRVHLNAADLIVPHVQPGQSIGVVGEWTATGSDAQAIISLNDATGHQWSTGDAPVPMGNTARTRPRRVSVPVPLTIPPGEYQLVLNVIDVASGGPLSTRRADGALGGIDWPLGSIVIDPAQTPIDPATRKPPITLNADLGGLRAIGTEAPPDPIITGDPWTLSMEWLAQADRLPAFDVQWDFVASGRVIYSTTLPLNPYSTEKWHAGDVLQSKYDFRVPIEVPAGTYDLQFKVIDRATQQPLTNRAVELTKVSAATRPRSFTAPSAAHPLDVSFDQVATLSGVDINRAGPAITVTLYWQAQAITTTNFTAFVQLIGADDQVQQQIDNWQIAFNAPTSTWLPGQVIADQYVFEVSSDAAIGVGLYNAATGERLPALEAGQRWPQDRVVIK